jgi:hypothetical protein
MVDLFFSNISKKSYHKSIYLHLSVLLFVIIPLSYFVPQYLDSGKIVSKGEIKLITISEDDYKKIVKNTTKTNTILPNTAITKTNIDEFVKIVKKNPPTIKKAPKKIKSKTIKESILTNNNNSINKIDNIVNNNEEEKIENLLVDPESKTDKEEKIDQETIDVVNSDTQKTTIFGDAESVVFSSDIQISIKDIIAVQISKCWNDYYDENFNDKNMIVTAVIGYRQNGSINKIDIENKFILGSGDANLYNIMVQNAKRSIINCSPIKGLPVSSYDDWRYIKINFKNGKNLR